MAQAASTDRNPVDDYAQRVVDGLVPAGKYHQLACARHLHDRQRENTPGFPYRFVWEERDRAGKLAPCAARFFNFARRLKHYKGQWAGQPFTPSEFQVFTLGSIFGWRHVTTGLRRFTTAYNELPRKQGKSFAAAAVAIYATFFEGEAGAEGFCIATKEKQAADVVFRDAKQMIRSSGLSSRLKVQVKNIHREATASKLEPLGSDSETLDGLNPHSITTDELHAFKTRDLIDVMESATGARRNPLHYQITTAGSDPVSPCGDQHDYACKILDGVLEDDPSTVSFFACICHADPDDDWQDERTWRKANPHYGISVLPDDLAKLAAKAKNMPAAAAEFKQKRLNLWVNADQPCLSLDGWRKGQSVWSAEDVDGEPCYVGVDLASKIDLMALSCVFPPTKDRPSWRLLQYIWTPLETVDDRAHRDRAPYRAWIDQGWLRGIPGSTMDPAVVRTVLVELRDRFRLLAIGFDPWHADQIIRRLVDDDGFDEEQALEVPQTYAGVSSAEAKFQAEVLAGRVDARGCPVTAWAASNVVNVPDGKMNVFFSKRKSRSRIDPIKAATTAIALAIRGVTATSTRKTIRPAAFILGDAGIVDLSSGSRQEAAHDDPMA